MASFLDARAHDGRWILRLDDIDAPRSSETAASIVRDTLVAHGLQWDGEITRQSDNMQAYVDALTKLSNLDLLFYCTCSRSQLRRQQTYPGTCRERRAPIRGTPTSIRIRVDDSQLAFYDRVQGEIKDNLALTEGDFIVMRKDGIVAYPLAVVIDDVETGVNHVVRGSDLCEHTLTQIYLNHVLELPQPHYLHIPVLNQKDDIKLSKRDKALAVDNRFPMQNLYMTLHMLGFEPPQMTIVEDLIDWGIENWDTTQIPKQRFVSDFTSI